MLANFARRFYSPRVQSPAILSVIEAFRKDVQDSCKVAKGALSQEPAADLLMMSDLPLTGKVENSLICSPRNVEKVLGDIPFTRHSSQHETIFIARVEVETTRRALMADLEEEFKKVLVDPKDGSDEGWTCCHIPGPSRACTVHILSPEAADYYMLHELYT
jgi:hypothetical protein